MVVEVTVAAAMVVVDFMAAEAGFMAAVPPTLAVVFIAAAAFIPSVPLHEPARGSAAAPVRATPNSVPPRMPRPPHPA
ncbi:hypothetical protein ACVINW_007663 [Bradyrhizobium sp. USDA 4461]